MLLLGIPYALAVGQEQEIVEREREEGLMREGASSVSFFPFSLSLNTVFFFGSQNELDLVD